MPKSILPISITAEQIDAWLPQTQCTQCGYPRCSAYAEAIVRAEANINQCPPGGETTLHALAKLLRVEALPLDPRFGKHKPRARAIIDEKICIGCRKCIEVCPVDAILGARKWMHTVIAAECTGCELCLPPCPVDCIVMESVDNVDGDLWPEYTQNETKYWRRRNQQRLERLKHPARLLKNKASNKSVQRADAFPEFSTDKEKIRADIRAAVDRVKKKKQK